MQLVQGLTGGQAAQQILALGKSTEGMIYEPARLHPLRLLRYRVISPGIAVSATQDALQSEPGSFGYSVPLHCSNEIIGAAWSKHATGRFKPGYELLVNLNESDQGIFHRRRATTMSQSPPVQKIRIQSRQVIRLHKLPPLAEAAAAALEDALLELETLIIGPFAPD